MVSEKAAIAAVEARQNSLLSTLTREVQQLVDPLSTERALQIAHIKGLNDERLVGLFAHMLRYSRNNLLHPNVVDAIARRKATHGSKRLLQEIIGYRATSKKTLDYLYDLKEKDNFQDNNWSLVVMFASHPNASNKMLNTILNKALKLNDAATVSAIASNVRSYDDINRIWEYVRKYDGDTRNMVESLAENPNLPRKIMNIITRDVKAGKYNHKRSFINTLAGNYSTSVKSSLSLLDYIVNLTIDDYPANRRTYFWDERVHLVSRTAKLVFAHPRMHVSTLMGYIDHEDRYVQAAAKTALDSRLDDIPAYLSSLGTGDNEFDSMTPDMIRDIVGLN
jgi:hypothetical protein